MELDKFTGSVATMAKDLASPQFFEEPNFHPHATQLINSTAACVDQIAGCFNEVMTMIDGGKVAGNEKALFTYEPPRPGPSAEDNRRRGGDRAKGAPRKTSRDHPSKRQGTAVEASVVSGSYFSKMDMYANSRLPMNLPPLRL